MERPHEKSIFVLVKARISNSRLLTARNIEKQYGETI